VYSTFPDVNAADQEIFKFPADIEEAKRLGELLSRYRQGYPKTMRLKKLPGHYKI